MSTNNTVLSLTEHFAKLPDPRVERTRLHNLVDIVVMAICAVIAHAEGWEEIEDFGRAKFVWFKRFLELPNGIPSHDTFRRVFCLLDPAAFQGCFAGWISALATTLGLKQIAIDGKTLRRSLDRAAGKAALHLVSAWATANQLSLGQVAVDNKSNEITAIPRLLELLDVSGAIVTIDAMGCQKDIAERIRQGGGDYVLAVKDNQPRLLEDIQACFSRGFDTDFAKLNHSYHETVERHHGRVEARTYHTIQNPEGIRDRALWKDLQAITIVVSERQVNGQDTTTETRYFIGSKATGAKAYASYVRSHWSIENNLHWVLDVTFDEDHSRKRTDHSPENFALLRRLALSLLKQHSGKASVRRKRLRSGWDEAFLAEVLSGK
jgi:predicted transposase YbfD/YdcC